MQTIDWWVMLLSLLGIILYGLYKSKYTKNLEGYFLGGRNMPWYLILLGIMGTQASAITFLSAPGQAYTDGMRFVQYYFGLPIAMIVISWVFVPIFHQLKVFTAYEFLENRFDVRTRTLTALLFLISRGLSTGISIYAPSIIISALLGWNIYLTNLLVGGLLIIYTVSGGAKSVAYTQRLQFFIIMGGMLLAAIMVIKMLPAGIGFHEALQAGGLSGKMNIITNGAADQRFDWNDRYNIWSGTIGGFFLALSYFGTDQSQVGRYISSATTKESRMGLLLNGIVKVPMQFFILLVGVLVFAFYQYRPAPVFFNETLQKQAMQTTLAPDLQQIQTSFDSLSLMQTKLISQPRLSEATKAQIRTQSGLMQDLRKKYSTIIKKAIPAAESNDTNYIFLYFITRNLPHGFVGLLLAAIIMAAWGSIAAALNALASCTVIDIHFMLVKKQRNDLTAFRLSWQYTLAWGLFCIGVAMFATNMGSLIEAVNILGSLFYGVILGIFLVAFFQKWVGGVAVFWAALIIEAMVITLYNLHIVSFLWLNMVGALGMLLLAPLAQIFAKPSIKRTPNKF